MGSVSTPQPHCSERRADSEVVGKAVAEILGEVEAAAGLAAVFCFWTGLVAGVAAGMAHSLPVPFYFMVDKEFRRELL